MKIPSFWKKPLYSALVFFGTLIVLSVGYATWNSAMSKVTVGNPLTATAWNALVDNITDIDSRWSRSGGNIAFTGGNVGIGTVTPGAKLDVNGDIHISGDLYSTGWTLLVPSSYYTGNVYYKIVGKHVVFRGTLNSTLNGRAAGWYYLFDSWPAEIAL